MEREEKEPPATAGRWSPAAETAGAPQLAAGDGGAADGVARRALAAVTSTVDDALSVSAAAQDRRR